jgi:hypothetical protein
MHRKILSSLSIFLVGFLTFSGSVWSGEVQTITLGGQPLTLTGEKLKTGKMFPTVLLPDLGLNMVDLQSFKRKVTLLSVSFLLWIPPPVTNKLTYSAKKIKAWIK